MGPTSSVRPLLGPPTLPDQGPVPCRPPGTAWAEEIGTDLAGLAGPGELWVVDAVDGAVQYLQGLPQWSVRIALAGRPWQVDSGSFLAAPPALHARLVELPSAHTG